MNDDTRTKTDYADILKYDVKQAWEDENNWKELCPDAEKGSFSWEALDIGAVYRVTLCRKIDIDGFAVCKSDFAVAGTIVANSIISVGKTKNLAQRMQQHFTPSKINSNRLLTRLKNLFPEADGRRWLSRMILERALKIEYFPIPDEFWWQRDLLESYGKAVHCCLFDLEIEH